MGSKQNLGNAIYGFIRRTFPKSFERTVKRSDFVQGLEGDLLYSEIERSKLEHEHDLLSKDYEQLQGNYFELESKIPGIRKQISMAVNLCKNVKTGRDVIEARVDANEGDNRALQKWQETYAEPLEKRMLAAEKEVESLKQGNYGLAVNITMKSLAKLDSRTQKIPLILYNNIDDELSYTPATIGFLGINGEEAEKFNFRGLLKRINLANLKGENGILNAIRTGTPLSHYDAKTRGKNPIDMKLTTYPISYHGKNLGIGILLYDPKFSFHFRRNKSFVKNLDNMFRTAADELNSQIAGLARKRELGFG